MPRIPAIYDSKTTPNGTQFKIQATGQTWTLYVKPLGVKKWERVQQAYDAKFLDQVMRRSGD